MEERSRLELLLNNEQLNKLANMTVMIFGLGGVGSYSCEAIARMFPKKMILVDNDTYSISNINRQLYATHKTLGLSKVEVAKDKIKSIYENIEVQTYNLFLDKDTINEIDFRNVDFIIDAIDTMESKVLIIKKAKELNINIISSMGTGNKLHPELLEITDISKTSVCPMAKKMRKLLKEEGINHLDVVYSKEEPINPYKDTQEKFKRVPGSTSFTPSVAGLLIASHVFNKIIEK